VWLNIDVGNWTPPFSTVEAAKRFYDSPYPIYRKSD